MCTPVQIDKILSCMESTDFMWRYVSHNDRRTGVRMRHSHTLACAPEQKHEDASSLNAWPFYKFMYNGGRDREHLSLVFAKK